MKKQQFSLYCASCTDFWQSTKISLNHQISKLNISLCTTVNNGREFYYANLLGSDKKDFVRSYRPGSTTFKLDRTSVLKLKSVQFTLSSFKIACKLYQFIFFNYKTMVELPLARSMCSRYQERNAERTFKWQQSFSQYIFLCFRLIFVDLYKVMEFQKSHRQRLAANNDKKVLSTADDADVYQ